MLVWGVSTSVGSNAIKLARNAGYRVVATASPRNFDYVRSPGAAESVDYRSPAAVDGVRVSAIWGGTLKDNEVGPPIYVDFLPPALATGAYRAAPDATVVGDGLARIPTRCGSSEGASPHRSPSSPSEPAQPAHGADPLPARAARTKSRWNKIIGITRPAGDVDGGRARLLSAGRRGDLEMTATPETSDGTWDAVPAERGLQSMSPAPVLITEQEVLLSTTAAVSAPATTTRWWTAAARGIAAVLRRMVPMSPADSHPVYRYAPERYEYLERALLSREMGRL